MEARFIVGFAAIPNVQYFCAAQQHMFRKAIQDVPEFTVFP